MRGNGEGKNVFPLIYTLGTENHTPFIPHSYPKILEIFKIFKILGKSLMNLFV